MAVLYILFIGVGGFPLFLTLRRINKYRSAKKRGGLVRARVTHVHTVPVVKGLPHDRLTLNYYDFETGGPATVQAGTTSKKYKVGDQVEFARSSTKGDVIIPDDAKGYLPMLFFSLALFVFVIFAAFKISELE